jgi:hypothetical protein
MVEHWLSTKLEEQEHENFQEYDIFMGSGLVWPFTDLPLNLKTDFDQADARNCEALKKRTTKESELLRPPPPSEPPVV